MQEEEEKEALFKENPLRLVSAEFSDPVIADSGCHSLASSISFVRRIHGEIKLVSRRMTDCGGGGGSDDRMIIGSCNRGMIESGDNRGMMIGG